MEEKLALARNRLLELDREYSILDESTMKESTTESKKIVVVSGVSLERYRKFFKEERRRFNVYVRLIKGEVIAYELPSPAHGSVVAEIAHMLRSWSNHQLIVFVELDITIGNNSEYCSDIAAVPRQVPPPAPGSVPQPTIFVEVARTETLSSLNDLTADYFSASFQSNFTQVYLAVKLFPRRQDGTAAMLALLYLRNNQIPKPVLNVPNPPPNTQPMIVIPNTIPNIAISFGSASLDYNSVAFLNNTGIQNHRMIGFLQANDIACTAAGMPTYQLTIPANLIFPNGVPPGIPNNFNIDLWELQETALYFLVCTAFMLF
jgi:hypothetical protein